MQADPNPPAQPPARDDILTSVTTDTPQASPKPRHRTVTEVLRHDKAYGVFWRFPPWRAQVLCTDGPGETRAHGSLSPWLCVRCPQESVSVVLVRRGPVAPWFARAAEYLGAGPSLAWQDRREMPPGRPLEIGLDAIIVDSALADEGTVGYLMERLGH